MTTASGTWRIRRSRALMPAGASAAATTCPPHAPSMCPPTTAASCSGPHEARRQPRAGRREERGAEDVPALLERIGDGDHDPLAVDQQVRHVVRDQVAERDRHETGPDRPEADRPGDREGQRHDDPEEDEQED